MKKLLFCQLPESANGIDLKQMDSACLNTFNKFITKKNIIFACNDEIEIKNFVDFASNKKTLSFLKYNDKNIKIENSVVVLMGNCNQILKNPDIMHFLSQEKVQQSAFICFNDTINVIGEHLNLINFAVLPKEKFIKTNTYYNTYFTEGNCFIVYDENYSYFCFKHGGNIYHVNNQALIMTRNIRDSKLQFVAITIDFLIASMILIVAGMLLSVYVHGLIFILSVALSISSFVILKITKQHKDYQIISIIVAVVSMLLCIICYIFPTLFMFLKF